MAEHRLKCWPSEFSAIERGDKHFEVRVNLDRDFSIGDTLVLEKWDPAMNQHSGGYVNAPGMMMTPASLRVLVTYILHGGRFGLPEGLCVMSIRKVDE